MEKHDIHHELPKFNEQIHELKTTNLKDELVSILENQV
jgi:hypothetical protein